MLTQVITPVGSVIAASLIVTLAAAVPSAKAALLPADNLAPVTRAGVMNGPDSSFVADGDFAFAVTESPVAYDFFGGETRGNRVPQAHTLSAQMTHLWRSAAEVSDWRNPIATRDLTSLVAESPGTDAGLTEVMGAGALDTFAAPDSLFDDSRHPKANDGYFLVGLLLMGYFLTRGDGAPSTRAVLVDQPPINVLGGFTGTDSGSTVDNPDTRANTNPIHVTLPGGMAVVPEPGTLTLLPFGALALAGAAKVNKRRRRRDTVSSAQAA